MKKPLMFLIGSLLSIAGYSQTVPEKVDKQIKDPKRSENAGKADVIAMDKRQIFDSTTFKEPVITTNKTAKAQTKKKNCTRKSGKRKA